MGENMNETDWVERKEILRDVCQNIVTNSRYYSILGPKKIGKTTFLKQIKYRIEKEHDHFKCVYIDLGNVKTASSCLFYSGLIEKIISELNWAGNIKEKDSVHHLKEFVISLLEDSQIHLILLLDEIEHVPEYLTIELLGQFRTFNQSRDRETAFKQLSVIISGSTNLLEFTLKDENSPFNIAHPLLLSDLAQGEAELLIDKVLSQKEIQIELSAKEKILMETNCHPYLISKICELCADDAFKSKSSIGISDVERNIESLIKSYATDQFFSYIIRQVESDIDIFKTAVEILERGSSYHSGITITIGKHELSGAFVKDGNKFQLRNKIIDTLFRKYFDTMRKGDIFTLLEKWEEALPFYKHENHDIRIKRRREDTVALTWRRKFDIIKSIGKLMYSPREIIKTVFEYLLDGIYYALSYDSVCLYFVNKEQNCLEIYDRRGITDYPQSINLTDKKSLEVRAYQSERYIVEDKNEKNNYATALPIKLGEDDIRVLSINNYKSQETIKYFDCEELRSFANEAELAIKTSQNIYNSNAEKNAILETMGEELSIIDEHYNIIYMNSEKVRKIGANFSGTGKKCYEAFAKQMEPCSNCPCQAAMKEGKIIRSEEYHREFHKGRQARFIIQTASPLKNADGKCIKAVNVARDVSKLKKLFDIIEKVQKEMDYHKLINLVLDGIRGMGYKRVRFYKTVNRAKEELVVGEASRGMGTAPVSFSGYQIAVAGANYLEETLKEGKPNFYFGNINDSSIKDKQWLKDLALENIKWMDLPLISGKKNIGYIAVDNKDKGDNFTKDDLNFMATLASYTAQAIENSMYFQRQKTLYEISNELTQTLDRKKLLQSIVEKVCKILQAEFMSIFIYNEDNQLLERKAAYLYSKNGLTHEVGFNESYELGTYICGRVFQKGVPIIIDDFEKEEIKNQGYITQYAAILNSEKVHNSIFAPVTYKNHKIGIIRASNKMGSDGKLSCIGFTQDDLDLLVSIGEQIAIYLANSSLYEQQKKSVKQLEVLTDISNFIQKEDDLDKIFHLILTALTIQGGLEFNRAILFLEDKNLKSLKGEMAIGPADGEEARQIWEKTIWKELKNNQDNKEMLKFISDKYDKKKQAILKNVFNKTCQSLKFNVNRNNVLIEAFKLNKTISYKMEDDFNKEDEFLSKLESRCWAVAPLLIDEKAIGVIYVDNRFNGRKIEDQQVEILKLFANQAAIAIHNSRLRIEKSIQLIKLQELNKVIEMITSAANLTTIYKSVEDSKRNFENIDEMCLLIKKGEDYIPEINCPNKGEASCEDCKKSERDSITKGNTYEDHYCPNVDEDKEPHFKNIAKPDLKSRYFIPLTFKNQLLGIFDVGSRKIEAFSEFDRNLLKSLASQVAIALNNKLKQKKQKEIFRDISHSLGTYLTTMRGYSQRLLEGKVKTPEKKEEYLKRLFNDVLWLDNSVDEISQLVSLEFERMTFKMGKVDICKVTNSIVQKNEFLMNEKRLILGVSGTEQPIFIKGDHNKLEEALQSLLSNAIKFSEKDGTIKISVSSDIENALIRIEDEGIGIHEDDIRNIFNKYERGRNAKDNQIPGTGIGLSIVKHIIEKHSGKINVQSALNKGSIFTIKLPLKDQAEAI